MLRVIVALFVLMLLPSGAHADRRVALVIGNSAYQHTAVLPNPKNDAADVSALLKKLNFQVVDGLDLDKATFDRKVRDFAAALVGADVGVFFFAGHGLQVAGHNYLVPVDAELKTASALDFEMVRADIVQRAMESEASTNILFLDACRDNPLSRNLARAMGTRSSAIGRRLATIESGSGTLISFSTQPGNVALDGAGRNSPFAGALVKFIAGSNDDLNRMLIAVRNEVKKETQGRQVPWENSALTAPFYFKPAVQAPTLVPIPPSAPSVHVSEAERIWQTIKETADVHVLEAFRRQYGPTNLFFDRLAEARIEELKMEPAPGTVFKDCPDCPEMVVVPPGSFIMGSPSTETNTFTHHEVPQHKVAISRSIAVGTAEITFAEWEACVAGGGCVGNRNPGDQGWGRGDRPVINVSWDDAKGHVAWLSQKTGKHYRLLSEAEWEYAARAGTSTAYSWGNAIGRNKANCKGCGGEWDGKQTAPANAFYANAFRLRNMLGNVWEWVEDCWHGSYEGAPTDGSPWVTSCTAHSGRVVRGGAWSFTAEYARAASRVPYFPDSRHVSIGFRVARTLN